MYVHMGDTTIQSSFVLLFIYNNIQLCLPKPTLLIIAAPFYNTSCFHLRQYTPRSLQVPHGNLLDRDNGEILQLV
jgi:hypothetical protein